MPLGLMPESAYDEQAVTLAFGETVLFYSDGLVEAHDPQREMFDLPRLMAVAAASPPCGAELIQRVLAELDRFTGPGWEQEDDLMVLTLERRKEAKLACPTPISPRWMSATLDLLPTPA
jgi:serine phosphatase RsbU (regulator of sigma subunit)